MCAGRAKRMIRLMGAMQARSGRWGQTVIGGARPFLSMLSAGDVAALRALAAERTVDAGTVLLHSGAPGTTLLLVLDGRLKVITHASDGRELLLHIAGPGDLIGELGAVDGRVRCASAIAIDRVCVGALDARAFHSLLAERPSVAMAVMRVLAQRIRESDRELMMLASQGSLGRIVARLLQLAERFGTAAHNGIRIELEVTQEELAAWTGASRESVARALRLLRRLGLVTTSRRAITIVDFDALSERLAAA
jgi:CRP/FNR family transcriptional regulator, cyclic AMP receptor protein